MRKLLGLALSLALVASACGGDSGPDPSEDPQGALTAALERLGEYEGTTIGLSLATDVGSLVAMSEGDLSDDDAQKIVDSSLVITSKSAENIEDQQSEIRVNVAGTENAVEMKGIGNTLYVRADVAGLMETFGQDPAQLEQIRAEAGSAPGFEFIGPALDGEWIALTGYTEALESMTGQSMETPDSEDQAAIKKFADSLAESASVTEGDKEGPGDHLIAEVNVRDVYEDLRDLVSQVGQLPTDGELPPVEEVPDQTVSVDTWVDGGHLKQVEFDFTQLAEFGDEEIPEGVENFGIRMSIEEFTGSVEAPDGATEVDFSTLFQNFFGAMGGGLGGESTEGDAVPADICAELEAQLEGQDPEVIEQVAEQFAAECPNLGQ